MRRRDSFARVHRAFADSVLDDESPRALARLRRAAARFPVGDIRGVWGEYEHALDERPRRARGLAYFLIEIARRENNAELEAGARLAMVRALNRCGEFRQVRELTPAITAHLTEQEQWDTAGQVWQEAARAESYLGDLNAAEANLASAAAAFARAKPDTLVWLRSEQVRARILRDRGEYPKSIALCKKLLARFERRGARIEAARVLREMGHTYARYKPMRAFAVLREARAIFMRRRCYADAGQCDYFIGQAYHATDRLEKAVASFERARTRFAREQMPIFAAWCELDMGLAYWFLHKLEPALDLLQRARETIAALGSPVEASSCAINIAGVLTELYRFDEAMELYQPALEQAMAEQRPVKVAVCCEGIGAVYDRQGLYGQALDYYLRAREGYAERRLTARLVGLDLQLGMTHLHLGQYEQALDVLSSALEHATTKKMKSDRAKLLLARGEALLEMGRDKLAAESLRQARRLFQRLDYPVQAAVCDRLIAMGGQGSAKRRLRRLAASERVFARKGLAAQVGMNTLARGELLREKGDLEGARREYDAAKSLLKPGFPDMAWRAECGLGRIALERNEEARARGHLRQAVNLISQVRANVPVERESNSLFGARRDAFDLMIRTGIASGHFADALFAMTTAKAQSLMQGLGRDEREISTRGHDEKRDAAEAHERALRADVLRLRTELLNAPERQSKGLRGKPEGYGRVNSPTLRALNQKIRAYNKYVTQAELARKGFGGNFTEKTPVEESLRAVARARWGSEWAALTYYVLNESEIAVLCLTEGELYGEIVRLSESAQMALAKCADTRSGQREILYRGTLGGFAVPPGPDWLGETAETLLPNEIRRRLAHLQEGATLIVSPHGILHQLPLGILRAENAMLLDRFVVQTVPNLRTLVELDKLARTPVERLLICGLGEFGGRAAELPDARREVEAVEALSTAQVTTLWGAGATAEALRTMDAEGALAKFDALHFVTHIVLYGQTPHLSGIRLADGDLTVLDIARMELNAQYVFLSGCSSGLGEGGAGDEVVGLARAFFQAGARSVIASLWAVQDEATVTVAARMYEEMKRGASPARALRAAQLGMRAEGYPAYDWAGFVLMGDG